MSNCFITFFYENVLRPNVLMPFCRVGGVEAEVSPLLVHICQDVPDMGMLPLVAEGEGVGDTDGDGSLPGPGHHHMHRAEHPLHGSGTLPYDGRVQHYALSGQFGEFIGAWVTEEGRFSTLTATLV